MLAVCRKEPVMSVDLDTFLVALYTAIDDGYREHCAPAKPVRPGPPVVMSDSEVLTVLVCAHWSQRSERAMLAYVATAWRAYFPHVLDHSAFNRRARDLTGVLLRLIPQVAAHLGAGAAAYQALDGVAVPLARRCRGRHRRLFGWEAGRGRGGSDRDWYYGCELLLAVTDRGAITGFVLGPPATDDRWLADALLCWRRDPQAAPTAATRLPPSHRKGGGRVGPTGPIWPRSGVGTASPAPYLGDRGFDGAHWAAHWQQDYGATVHTVRDLDPTRPGPAPRQVARWRQVVERVNQELLAVFGLHFPEAKTAWGLLTRVAAKLLACNLGQWLNTTFGRPPLALATLFP
jgi:hypothetical protein